MKFFDTLFFKHIVKDAQQFNDDPTRFGLAKDYDEWLTS